MAITKIKTDAAPRDLEDASAGFAQVLEQLASHIGSSSRTDSVFGAPITSGELTIIPVARVIGGFGAGAGAGTEDQPGAKPGGGGGAGGGGGYIVSPVGVFEIGPQGVRFRRAETPALSLWAELKDVLALLTRQLLRHKT